MNQIDQSTSAMSIDNKARKKPKKITMRVLAIQIKAATILTLSGHLRFKDIFLIWLVAIGIINKTITVRPKPIKGHSLYVRPMTTDLRTLKDTFCNKFHRPFIQKAETILDLGANVGYVAADFAVQFPSAKIVAVELDSKNHYMLVQNTLDLKVEALHAAVWTHEKGITYDASRNEDAYAAVSTEIPTEKSIRMDTLIAKMGGWVDFVKMDIEGGERELITADADWLNSVGLLKVELHVSDEDCKRIADALENHGLTVTRDKLHANTFTAARRIPVNPSAAK